MVRICRRIQGNSKGIEQVATNTSNTLNNQTVEWKYLNWRQLERVTFKLQKRIFQASERGDVKTLEQTSSIPSRSNAGIPLRIIQEINGHSNLEQLQRYLSLFHHSYDKIIEKSVTNR